MDKKQEPVRNRPSEEGKRNDPDLRDESAAQPGTNTMSDSATDDSNNHLTKTASDSFRTEDSDSEKADPRFDDVNNQIDNAID